VSDIRKLCKNSCLLPAELMMLMLQDIRLRKHVKAWMAVKCH